MRLLILMIQKEKIQNNCERQCNYQSTDDNNDNDNDDNDDIIIPDNDGRMYQHNYHNADNAYYDGACIYYRYYSMYICS